MLRPGLATLARRNADRAPMMRQAQAVAAAHVDAASGAAVVAEAVAAAVETQVDDALAGDLVERSPVLAERLRQLEERLGDLEPSPVTT